MSGPTYISDPSLWEQFYHTDSGKNFVPMIRRKPQKGQGGIYRRKSYMIPVKSAEYSNSQNVIQQVTPVVAEQQRAISELKETMRNVEPHMPLRGL